MLDNYKNNIYGSEWSTCVNKLYIHLLFYSYNIFAYVNSVLVLLKTL